MNKIDDEREKRITDEARDCFNKLQEKQLGEMGPLTAERKQVAKTGLLAAYINLAAALHSQESGNAQVAINENAKARQAILEMFSKLQSVG